MSASSSKTLPCSVPPQGPAVPIQPAVSGVRQSQGTSANPVQYVNLQTPAPQQRTMSSSSTSARPLQSGLGAQSGFRSVPTPSASQSPASSTTQKSLTSPSVTSQRQQSNRPSTRAATRRKVASSSVSVAPAPHTGSPQSRQQSAASVTTTSLGGSITSTVHPVTPTPAPTATSGCKRKREEEEIEAAAVDILIGLPGINKSSLGSMLQFAKLLTPSDPMHRHILTYINNGHRHHFGMEVMSIIRFIREDDTVDFDEDSKFDDKFRMMLWHGTTPTAAAAILQNGFQTPVTRGQMFGTGIYFADRASKSANYCSSPYSLIHKDGDIGYLFLCDVLLGYTYNAKQPHHEYTAPPTATTRNGETLYFDSVKCTGEYIPDASENEYFGGSLMPIGKTVRNTMYPSYSVVHNEYVVYSAEKVKPKFLVKIKFRPSPVTN